MVGNRRNNRKVWS